MEIEAKFAVPDTEQIKAWQSTPSLGPFHLTPPRVDHMHDVYLDTEDYHLWRAGFVLRRREYGDGRILLTLKALQGGETHVKRRIEEEVVLPECLVSDSARLPAWHSRIEALTSGGNLTRLFTLEQRRTVRHVRRKETPAIALSLDHVRLHAEERETERYQLEAELLPAGNEELLEEVAQRLEGTWGFVPTHETKLGLAVDLFDLQLPHWEQRPELPPATAAALPPVDILKRYVIPPMRNAPYVTGDALITEAVRTIFAFYTRRILLHEPAAHSGDDDGIHDMRVATRRLRTAARTFKAYLPAQVKPSLKEIKCAAEHLGRVRDLDVFWRDVRAYQQRMEETRPPTFETLERWWKTQHHEAMENLRTYLDGERYGMLRAEFLPFIAEEWKTTLPTLNERKEALPRYVRHVTPLLIQKRLTALLAYGPVLDTTVPPTKVYHRLRITGKRLRYTLEYLRHLFGDTVEPRIQTLKALQDHLGDMQDTVAARHLLDEYAKEHGEDVDPEVRAYKRYCRNRHAELQEQFPELWQNFREPAFPQRLAELIASLYGSAPK